MSAAGKGSVEQGARTNMHCWLRAYKSKILQGKTRARICGEYCPTVPVQPTVIECLEAQKPHFYENTQAHHSPSWHEDTTQLLAAHQPDLLITHHHSQLQTHLPVDMSLRVCSVVSQQVIITCEVNESEGKGRQHPEALRSSMREVIANFIWLKR